MEQLRTSYQAGHAIALTGAEAADAELLRDLLGQTSGAGWSEDIPQADLVAFRRAIRPNGRTHESTTILLPRVEVDLPPAEAGRGGRQADMLAIEALSGLFSGTPVVPEVVPSGVCFQVPADQCLEALANSSGATVTQSDNFGNQVGLENWAWALRSFGTREDLYHVLQEINWHVGLVGDPLQQWSGGALSNVQDMSPPPPTIQSSPLSNSGANSVISSISDNVGGASGWNQIMGGLNATLTGVTISALRTIQNPLFSIDNSSEMGSASWGYNLVQLPDGPASVTFWDQWIWAVPFTSYAPGQDTIDVFSETAQEIILQTDDPLGILTAQLNNWAVPLPFGDTFGLQPPVVTSVDPDEVCVGDEFTITGTGLYPNLVQAVSIDGTALDQSAFSTVSDTKITAVAPDLPGSGLPVEVQTAVAPSNDDVTIEIDSDACAPAGGTTLGTAHTRSAGSAQPGG